MTSLKNNFDNFSFAQNPTNNAHNFPVNQNSSLTLTRQNSHLQHQKLIEQISMKNNALTKHDHEKQKHHNNHPNYLTFCQKYADSLCQKYSSNKLKMNTACPKHTRNQQNFSINFLNYEQNISRKLILYRRYFQDVQFNFDKSHEDLLLKIKYLSKVLNTRNNSFTEKDQQVQNQLLIMQLFMNKINNKIKKHYFTPFTIFAQEIKSRTPQKLKKNYYEEDIIKNETPQRSQQKQGKTRSFIVAPNSPDLLQSFKQHTKEHSNMFVSFRQSMSHSQIMACDTLKYSQSELNINLERNHGKQHRQIQRDEQSDELPYSPVQPYRLHKLHTEANDRKQKQEDRDKSGQDWLFLGDKDQIASETRKEIEISLKELTGKQNTLAQRITCNLSESVGEINQIVQKSHQLIGEQKCSMNQQWSDILDQLGKDVQQIQNLLIVEKAQNDLKDKKFLENLQVIQNQLIQFIFEEKQSRKAQESVLTQVLTNLVDNLQQSPP